ncbi:MAG: SDR family oxidoreductase [Dehalococcoidia bacterium]|nr:SDR family oxidoreductase [Dehalococcoidia bacterium]
MKKRMRILVTGGAGFLGSHLCDSLVSQGHSIICVDNLLTGKLSNIEHLMPGSDFEFSKQNVSNRLQIYGDIDYVLHFASPASPIDYYKFPVETLKVGSMGTLRALNLARGKKAKFLLASTSEVYGDPLQSPQAEDYKGNVSSVGPRSVYDEAKRFAEAITMTYHRIYNIDTKIVRIFNTYGPRMKKDDGRAIPTFITQALENKSVTIFGDGQQTRSFCYVSDLIEGINRLMLSDFIGPMNLGNPEELTILDIARKIIQITTSSSDLTFKPLPEDDPKQRRPDITKAKKILGWNPIVKLDAGLRETIEWFKKNPD